VRLKRLEILGFKSFADPFIMDFEPGISSVVGPNGCGKSNVADALRWVLGTQSARQIRAEVMEDVIFKGSSDRKPLGMAEVTVTFDNAGRTLPLDFDEVSVTRRLFRSGASDYLINGNRCRLMDVTDLIVDRGLGSTGYWILEAEMVKTILSPRAEDRRELFDEAAGIGRYKIQRHRAGLKLETAGNDLERLSDIISEVERGHGVLKKQVAAYRRHEKSRDTVSQIRSAKASGELLLLQEKIARASREMEQAGAQEAAQSAALSSLEAALAEARIRLGEAQTRLDEAHARCAAVEASIASLERERAVALERISGMRRTAGENRARCARERERALKYGHDASETGAEALLWESRVAEAEKAEAEAACAAGELSALLENARRELEAAGGREAGCAKELAVLRDSYMERIKAGESRRQRIGELTGRLEDSRREILTLEENLRKIEMEDTAVRDARQAAENALEEASGALSRARERASETTLAAGEASALRNACAREVSDLKQALARAGSGDTLGSVLEPAPGMGNAVGACLDGFQSALPVDGMEPGLPCDGARYAVGGRKAPEPIPDGAKRMDGFIGAGCPAAESVLRHYVLAPDLETALDWFRREIPAGVVTLEGHLLRPDGTVRLGVPAGGAGILELAAAAEEAGKRLEGLAGAAETLAAEAASSREFLDKREREAENARNVLALQQRNEAVLSSRREEIGVKLAALVVCAEEAERELLAVTAEAGPDSGQDPGIRETEERLALLNLAARKAAAALEEAREKANEAFLAREKAGMDLREARGMASRTASRAAELGAEAETAERSAEELDLESGRLLQSAGEMEKDLEALSGRVAELERDREAAGENRNRAASVRGDLLQRTAALEEQVSSARTGHASARERHASARSETEAMTVRAEAVRREIPDAPEENPFLDMPPQALLDEEQRQLRIIEGIGPVNPLAVEEFREAEERLGFLTEQKRDLEEARESLETAISEINQEAQARFRDTFDRVREHFREVFVELFGGGEADITALEGDDPLEGGIQIMARPRGKKLESVTSLSGGERALAAVALLFSLYLVKASPFCILDELDAPLDDANIDSFMAILRRFSSQTQFLVMTHNKRTMEASDRLYGITMAEPGVSSLTTVSLSDYDGGVDEPRG
jgi:chromosome segregation protein